MMLFSDILRLSLRMFKARTLRTLLTILGMGIGIAAIVFLVSFGYGLQNALLERITTSDALSTLDVIARPEENTRLDEETVRRLSALPNVEDVVPVIELRGQVRIDDITLDSGLAIASPEYIQLEGIEFSKGTRYRNDAYEIAITSGVAQAFQIDDSELVGKTVSLSLFLPEEVEGSRRAGEVSASLDRSLTVVGVIDSEQNRVYVPEGPVTGLRLPDATKLKVKGFSTDVLTELRAGVENMSLTASSISETIDQANKVFQVLQIILMLFGVIALVVSAIGMFNTMTITLLERTEEIGIMKSIGASPASISIMFVTESTLMGLLGSLIGILLGIGGGETINIVFNFIAGRFGGESADLFSTPLWFITAIIIFGAFVGFLTGVFPARKAAKTDALEALRYK